MRVFEHLLYDVNLCTQVWFGIVLSALLVAGAFRALELCFKTSGNLVVNNMTFRSSFLYMTEVLFSQGAFN